MIDADNAWFSGTGGTYHPHKGALRCVPCNYPRSAPSLQHAMQGRHFPRALKLLLCRNMSLLPMTMTRGCPCTPEVMCHLQDGYNNIINPKACGPPRSVTSV